MFYQVHTIRKKFEVIFPHKVLFDRFAALPLPFGHQSLNAVKYFHTAKMDQGFTLSLFLLGQLPLQQQLVFNQLVLGNEAFITKALT